MKTYKSIIFTTLLSMLLVVKLNANFFNTMNNSIAHTSSIFINPIITDDPNIVISVTNINSRIDVNISFNGNEGSQGTLKIYNASNQFVSQFTIDLKSAPNFSTINLNEYASGTYSIELTTSAGVHVSHFTLQ